MKNTICLMGMPASGKSKVGKLLSEQLNKSFIDLDAEIERTANKSISEIFEEAGESAFRQMETDALQLALKQENTVIALGGGTPCFHNNLELILANSYSIYLDTALLYLHERLLKRQSKRPLLANKTPEELADYLEEIFSQRIVYYEKAHLVLECANASAERIVTEISSLV